ncbi:MAG: DUF6709 family protein, partial [Oscillospiraceae bacterium]
LDVAALAVYIIIHGSAVGKENFGMNEITEKKQPNKKFRNALLRVLAAFLVATALLAITGFAVIDLLQGAKEVDTVQDEAEGTFVKRDVYAILGFYGEDATSSGKVKGSYALVPMGENFVTVHFTQRYLDSAEAICNETTDYVNGKLQMLDKYVVVQGEAASLDEKTSGLMYEWFELNRAQLVATGVIADTNDAALYLSDMVLEVDTINGMSQTLVLILTGLAALLLLYVIFEFVLMAIGHYLIKPEATVQIEEAVAEDDGEITEIASDSATSFDAEENGVTLTESAAEMTEGTSNDAENTQSSESEIVSEDTKTEEIASEDIKSTDKTEDKE